MENLTSTTQEELSVEDLEKMAEKYKQRADELRREKRAEQVKIVTDMVREHGITPEEIFSMKGSKVAKVKRAYKARATPAPPKYRSKDGTMTWNGLGRRPAWIVELAKKDDSLKSALIKT